MASVKTVPDPICFRVFAQQRVGIAVVLVMSLATGITPTCSGEETTLREQAEKLGSILSHYAVVLTPREQLCFEQDDARFREIVQAIERDGATAELREIASGCRRNLEDLQSLVLLWAELRRDTPAPESQFWKMQEWVWEKSAEGAFQTQVTEYSNGVPTRSYTNDSTLHVAVGAAVVGTLLDRIATREHVASELQRKQTVASRMARLGDDVEQRRLQLQQKLLAIGYVPLAGPRKSEAILEARVSTMDEKRSPIEEWEKERQRRALSQSVDRDVQPPPRDVSWMQFKLRNTGPTLHHVALRVDFKHYRQPTESFVRQTYFIREWPSGEDIEIIDEFRLNSPNRATAGVWEELLSPNTALGMRVYPGFLGVTELTYSLSSDEAIQTSVTLSLDAHRKRLAKNCLTISEHWAWMISQGSGPSGPLTNLPPAIRKKSEKRMADTSKTFALAALKLNVLEDSERRYLDALSKNSSAVLQRTRELQAQMLAACDAKSIYATEIPYARESHGFRSGIYELTFLSTRPTATHIEARITRRPSATNSEESSDYIGSLAPSSFSPGFDLHLRQRTQPKNSTVSDPNAPAELSLRWEDSRWFYGATESFELIGEREQSVERGRPASDRPVTRLPKTRLPIGSIWEGTRKFVDSASGTVKRVETITVTIRESWRKPDPTEHFEGEFVIDGRFRKRGDITLSLDGEMVLNPMLGRRGDPYHYVLRGRLSGDVIEGAYSAGNGMAETELVRLQKKQ
ncbi:MAG: hypothetical protein KDA38_01080 [Planctomycetales bacterium]|nr:hypothetical protein [Planctomycetales bacterium]